MTGLGKIRGVVALLAAYVAMACFGGGTVRGEPPAAPAAFRPPAVPLVTSDPYLSIWSMADRLTDDVTRHWTRRAHPLVSLIRIDGKAYRLMGNEPKNVPVLPQVGVRVLPTQSIYDFDDGRIHVTLTFLTPALPDDLEVLARPLTYLTWDVRSVDGVEHDAALYQSTSALLTVDSPEQKVEWARETFGRLTSLRVGTVDQTLLRPAGDDRRIDWGYAYAAAPSDLSRAAAGADAALMTAFLERGALPAQDDVRGPRAANDQPLSLSFVFPLGKVGAMPASRHLMIAYDEIFAVSFLGRKLRPFWRRDGATPADLLLAAERDYPALVERAARFDDELMTDLTRVGGARYAQLAALAYRQALAGCGLAADANRQPQRLYRHRRRHIPRCAPVPALRADVRQGARRAGPRLQRLAALEVSVRAPRRRRLPAGERPGLCRRRDVDERSRHDARRREREHDPFVRRHRQDGGERRVLRAVVAAVDPVGSLSRKVRQGPRKPALHRRLHGPSGP
jgi:Domain of unknown function (DUF5127)/Domain of unknown function (DUF4964)